MTQPNATEEQTVKDPLFTKDFIMVALINLAVFMGFQMTNQGLPLYLSELGGNGVTVGLSTTLATLASVLLRPVVGAMIDRWGRKGLLISGFGMMGIVIICYALFPVIGVILVLRIAHGIGWGFGSSANMTLAADIIPKKRFAEGMGYFAMTNSLAMALGPVIAIELVNAGHSTWTLYLAAGFTFASAATAIYFFLTSYKQPPLKNDIPLSHAFKLSNMFEKNALFPSTIYGLVAFGQGAITSFIVLMGNERGIEGVSLYFILYAIANVTTRPMVGRIVDKYGYFQMGLVGCLGAGISLVLVAFAYSTMTICLAGIFVGFGLGAAMSVFNSMAVATAPPKSRGSATSTFLFFFNGGLAMGALIGGFAVEGLGYTAMFLIMAGMCVVASLVFLAGGKKRIDQYHFRQHQ